MGSPSNKRPTSKKPGYSYRGDPETPEARTVHKKNKKVFSGGYNAARAIPIAVDIASKGGGTNDIAAALGVSRKTLWDWKQRHKDFADKLAVAQALANVAVANMLYHRAMGYEHPEDKIFNNQGKPLIVPTIKHYPPDVEACKFFLTNRSSEDWKNRSTLSGDPDAPFSGNFEIYIGLNKFAGGTGEGDPKD